jgi:hypothetical protein
VQMLQESPYLVAKIHSVNILLNQSNEYIVYRAPHGK